MYVYMCSADHSLMCFVPSEFPPISSARFFKLSYVNFEKYLIYIDKSIFSVVKKKYSLVFKNKSY